MARPPSEEHLYVQFLGSGDAFGSGGRLQTAIYVQAKQVAFLIDCGATALIGMKRFGVDPGLIDLVLITHLHGDHFAGLPFVLLDAHFNQRRSRALTLAGPPGLEGRLNQAMDVLFPGSASTQWSFPREIVEFAEASPTTLGPLEVTPYPVVHESGAPSFALRVACGPKVIAYSGDTEWTESLIDVARGADLFICEAYFFDKKVPNHLDYQTLLDHRSELDCRKLVVTHLHKDLLDRRGLEIEAAEDGRGLLV